jgi:hypothetical protein
VGECGGEFSPGGGFFAEAGDLVDVSATRVDDGALVVSSRVFDTGVAGGEGVMAYEDVEGCGGAFEAADVLADPPTGPSRGLGAWETVEGVGGFDGGGVAFIDLCEEGDAVALVEQAFGQVGADEACAAGDEGVGGGHGVGFRVQGSGFRKRVGFVWKFLVVVMR